VHGLLLFCAKNKDLAIAKPGVKGDFEHHFAA